MPETAAPLVPRWPAWFAPAGFFGAFGAGTVIAIVSIAIVAVAAGLDTDTSGDAALLNLIGTVIQDAAFVVVAVGLAWTIARPRLWDFGLRRARFWPTIGWSLLGLAVFYLVVWRYTALLGDPEEQTTLNDLGVEDGTAQLVVAAALIIVVAPFVEELFFRGFFYRSLRGRFPVWAAALITGAVFGAVHVTTGAEAVPVLFVFGTILCLVYERTGTLYAAVAMHAVNNTLAFAVGSEKWALSLALGGGVLLACVVLPLLTRRPEPDMAAVAPAAAG